MMKSQQEAKLGQVRKRDGKRKRDRERQRDRSRLLDRLACRGKTEETHEKNEKETYIDKLADCKRH